MATYNVTAGDYGVQAKMTVANTVDTIQFANTVNSVEIISDGSAALYVSIDGSAPTVAGPKTLLMPAGAPSIRVVNLVSQATSAVKVISAGTVTYSIVQVLS